MSGKDLSITLVKIVRNPYGTDTSHSRPGSPRATTGLGQHRPVAPSSPGVPWSTHPSSLTQGGTSCSILHAPRRWLRSAPPPRCFSPWQLRWLPLTPQRATSDTASTPAAGGRPAIRPRQMPMSTPCLRTGNWASCDCGPTVFGRRGGADSSPPTSTTRRVTSTSTSARTSPGSTTASTTQPSSKFSGRRRPTVGSGSPSHTNPRATASPSPRGSRPRCASLPSRPHTPPGT